VYYHTAEGVLLGFNSSARCLATPVMLQLVAVPMAPEKINEE